MSHDTIAYSSYQEYMDSQEWQVKRRIALWRAQFRCQICNSSEHLAAHHRSYDMLYLPQEIEDLTILCKRCHSLYHDLMPEAPSSEKLRRGISEHTTWDDVINAFLKGRGGLTLSSTDMYLIKQWGEAGLTPAQVLSAIVEVYEKFPGKKISSLKYFDKILVHEE